MELLEDRDCLRLVTDFVQEDDVLALALTCSVLRNALFARFTAIATSDSTYSQQYGMRPRRIRTRTSAVVVTAARLAWVYSWRAHRPHWLEQGMGGPMVAERIARHGSLAALRWARANGCVWGSGTCYVAAIGLQIDPFSLILLLCKALGKNLQYDFSVCAVRWNRRASVNSAVGTRKRLPMGVWRSHFFVHLLWGCS